ncbi:hypothetical protein C3L33_20143, partial [Rhododendron williamsianum]
MSLPTPTHSSVLFTWEIGEFSKLKAKKLYSEIFYCGGYEWRLLVFPKGNNTEHLSVYLDVPDSASWRPGGVDTPVSAYQWSIKSVTQIQVANVRFYGAEHRFNAEESDLGFTSFLPLIKLNDPEEGFLVNDTIVLEAGVTIPSSYDSRKETGDNGLGNVEADIAGTTSQVRFSMKGQALPTMLLESFATFIASMSSTKVNELNEEALRLAANSIEDFEQVGLDLRWLKQRLEEAKVVKKHSDSVNTVESCKSALEVARTTVDSCTSALEVARAKVLELEDGLAKAKLEGEVMSRELPKSLGVNDSVLKDIV